MIDFRPGMRVVCLADFPRGGYGFESAPRRGLVYTVRDVAAGGGRVGLRLKELVNVPVPTASGTMERLFNAAYFHPLDERDEDIAVFRKLIEPTELERFKEPADPMREEVVA